MDSKRKLAFVHRDISMASFSAGNYALAKKFNLEAQTLKPELAGVSDMIQALDVVISTDEKVGKEVDRYKVLRVRPRDDEATIHKSFKELAVTVHPDRNKSKAAGGAFRIVTEAWGLLKHAEMRALYDEDRRRKAARAPGPAILPRPTFWTACPGCEFKFEYPRSFVDKTLRCPRCRSPFFSAEIDLPFAQTNVQAFAAGLFEPVGPGLVDAIASGAGSSGNAVRLDVPSTGASPIARPEIAGKPKPRPGFGPAVGPGRVVEASVQAGPSAPRAGAAGAATSTGEGGESRKRKRNVAVPKPEARGRTQDGLLKKLTEAERREMLMNKAKKAVLRHIYPK